MRILLLVGIVHIFSLSAQAQTPTVNAIKTSATITIDGNLNESIWQPSTNLTKTIIGTPNNTNTSFSVSWNSAYLYIGMRVADANLYNESTNAWDDDAFEIYIDADNNGGTTYGVNDRQFMKEWNSTIIWEKTNKTAGVLHAWAAVTGGYTIEMAIPWSNIAITNPVAGQIIGFDIANDDDDNGAARESQRMWSGDGDNWRYPRNFGDLILQELTDTQAPTAPANLVFSNLTQSSVILSWTASTDNVAVSGYDVYRNGVKVNTSLITTNSYSVAGLSAATAYQFYVNAKDAAGNTSANSNTIGITTPDTQAPTAPANLVSSDITQTSLTLVWSASTDNVAVAGYDVYQDGIKITTSLIGATTYNVAGLTSATGYQFYVTAKDTAGNISAASNLINVTTLSAPDTEPPTAPSDLISSGLTQSSVSLSWTASTDNIAVTGYDIYQNSVKINSSPISGVTYNINALSALTAYNYYVVAIDAAGNISENSNVINFITPDTQAPTAPAGLSASSLTDTSVVLIWSPSSDNIAVTGYDVYQNSIKINTAPVTNTTYSVTGLVTATGYNFFVRAFDSSGNNSANSNTVSITTPDVIAPTAPSDLISSNLTQSSVTISWTAAADNVAVSGYDIYQNGIKINASLVTVLTYTVTSLSALTAYNYYIVAIDAAGNISAGSNVINIITTDTQAPTAPTGLTTSVLTAVSVVLTWLPSTDNITVTGYDVYQNNIKINTAPVTNTTYTVTGLVTATSYSFFVRAFDSSGNNSANSNTVGITTPDIIAPSAPANLVSSNLASTSLTVSWTVATDNVAVTGYDIYQNGLKINTSIVTASTYNVSGLTAATTYSFYVRAVDAAGNQSVNSNSINVTTAVASASCSGTGTINFQRWNNISGTTVASLTGNANYPNNPSTTGTFTIFEAASNSGDNYGLRVWGYICPPATGSYTFWIASDDNSELWLSTTSSSANRVRIAYHTSYTTSRQWNKFATQKSVAISLNAGQLYFVEAIMKDGTGGDNLAVGWAKPGQSTTAPSEVIPGTQLKTSIPDSQAPSIPVNLSSSAIAQTSFTLSWSASTDNVAVTGYDVYRNAIKINTSTIAGTTYAVTGLTPSTSYQFTVKAKDAAGNESAVSALLNVTTLDNTAAIETFTQRTIIANQRMPHDLVYGPDGNIWYTERFGGTVSFVNPVNGQKRIVLSLGANMVRGGGQDGLMGLALHPQFNSGKPYMYISYTYESTSATARKTRIERYTYNSGTQTLGSPVTILQNIPGSNDHNSARLAIGPDLKLYYTVGDMGAGQFDNTSRANNAQNTNIYEGKVLRLNTEIDGSTWIPADNPFGNAVYTFGHRNPQGLVWGNVNGVNILYSSEHGPYSDDEINIIEASRNYGWPQVSGFCDDNYNGRTIGGFAVADESNNCAALNAKEPIRSLFPVSNPPTDATASSTWPSTAPSGTDFYGSSAIPGWQNSLLVAMLKSGTITRLKLSNNGLSIISDTIHYFCGKGRFRDVVVSPDGLKIYVACDSSGSTSGPTGGVTSTPANPGSILEFTYQAPVSGRPSNELITEAIIVEDKNDKTIDVYPNPATTFFVVYNYNKETGYNIELIDMNGRTVKRSSTKAIATRIEVSGLSNGLYILRLTDIKGKVIRTEKIIIQK